MSYTLTAKQAYDPASVTREQNAYNASNHALNDPGGWVQKESFSFLYDRAHEKIVYGLQLEAYNNTTTPNATGRTLTDGFTATVAPAATYNSHNYGNFNTAVKDIASGTVTLYPAYSAAQSVPNGVHGSDGTYRYLTDIINQSYTGVGLVDPRTSNLWVHAFGTSNPCSIYVFEASLNYAQRIFPWTAAAGSTNNHMELAGISDTYTYVFNQPYVLMTDRVLESGELANGYLYTYAKYAMPFTSFNSTQTQFRWCFTNNNHMYVVYTDLLGTRRNYKLLRVDEPTSAPYGGPQAGGGVTDVTPWTSTTGPNSNNANWATTWAPPSDLKLYDLRNGNLAVLAEFTPRQNTNLTTFHDPAYYRVDCTYFNIAGSTFDYREGFIKGYMKGTTAATFQAATGVADADWVVEQLLEVDADLNMHSYAFAGVDYTKRTFFAVVQPATGGGWTYNAATRTILILTYTFASGSAPTCSSLILGSNWDPFYPSFGPRAVYKVLDDWGNNTNPWYQSGFWSPADQAWWWDGADDQMANLDPSFTYEQWNSYSLPFVRIAANTAPQRSFVWSNIGRPRL